MSVPTLAQMLTLPSQDDVLDGEVLPELSKRAVRVTDWIVGGVYRGLAYVVAKMRADDRAAIASIAAGFFEDFAFGFATPPGGIDVTFMAPIIAKQKYYVDQIAASYTKRKITLTNTANVPYGPLVGSQLVLKNVSSPSYPNGTGNRYVLDEGQSVTIPANGSVTAIVRSEFPAIAGTTYNLDEPGATWQLVTASYPGVTATNPRPPFTDPIITGTSTGTAAVAGSGSASAFRIVVTIATSGNAGDGSVAWTWTITDASNNQASGSGTGATIAFSSLIGSLVTVTLTDSDVTPSWIAGDTIAFSTPGTDLEEAGADAETPQQLGTRCRALWPMLAFAKDSFGNAIPISPTMQAYAALALSASTQVKQVLVANTNVNGQIALYIAGQGVQVPGNVVTALGNFFAHYTMIGDKVAVRQPNSRTITLGGATVYCKAAQIAAAQKAVTSKIASYIGGTDAANPFAINGLVEHGYLVDLVRSTPGVTRVTDTALTINGAAADLQLPVTPGAYELGVLSGDASTWFTWKAV